MRYLFVTLSILVVWIAVILTALLVQDASGGALYLTALAMTILFFVIGFLKK